MSKSTLAVVENFDENNDRAIRYETINVTPELAEQWLSKNLGNRSLRQRKVDTLASDMKSGNWRETGEAIKFDWNGRLIDGQHRLQAIIASGVNLHLLVVTGLDPATQRVIDTGTKRSAGDALRMAGEGGNSNIVAAVVRILLAYDAGKLRTSASTVPDATHSQTLDYWSDRTEALSASAVVARRVAKQTGASVSVIGAFAIITQRIDATASFEFLQDIEQMRTSGKGDPRYTLIQRIRNLRESGIQTRPAEQLFYFLRAWNAYRAEEPLHGFKASTSAGPAAMPKPI